MAKTYKFCSRCACVHDGKHDSTQCTPRPELVAKCLARLAELRQQKLMKDENADAIIGLLLAICIVLCIGFFIAYWAIRATSG